eukprot:TRINITY_DN48601_c0_g1_i1.p1 TRINITY_DN48601_c0_g1~~TRINITY_DN48601_c0_g1_i1.p1  ORF type:complete len:270 (-),score=98.17 TRINITY_DN48601_c0_g1_i1:227-1036(-)
MVLFSKKLLLGLALAASGTQASSLRMTMAASAEYQAMIKQESLLVSVLDAASQAAKAKAESDSFYAEVFKQEEADILQIQSLGDESPKAASKASKAKKSMNERFPTPPPLNFKPLHTGTAQMAMSMQMLEGLYSSGKERIASLNANEKKSKAFFEAKQAEQDKRMKGVAENFKSGKLSEANRDDETKEYNRMFKYWQHVRERQHKQYVGALKIQHGTMKKSQQLLDLYKKALSGNAKDQAIAKEEIGKLMHSMGAHLFLLQTAKDELKK